MRFVVQRVSRASVRCDEVVVGSIGEGLCVLIGIHRDDTEADIDPLVKRLLKLRLFANSEGQHWKNSVSDDGRSVLAISQFTLFARTDKGSKPDFHEAAGADIARSLFDKVVEQLKSHLGSERVQTGAFGQFMRISLENEGPVTIILDSNEK